MNFDSLEGWQVDCANGAVADLFGSQRQRVWPSPVARLVYRGTSNKSTVVIRPPKPLPLPESASATTIWIYGNRWGYAPEPDTPPVIVSLLLLDRDHNTHTLDLVTVMWKEWWLVHKVLPRTLLERKPLQLAGIRIAGASNKENRELYFEDLVFFQESFPPLAFEPRPKRGADPFPGQSPGANSGPGRLPFPTREETILPENQVKDFVTTPQRAGDAWRLTYKDAGTQIEYELKPGKRFWNPVPVRLNGARVARAMAEAGPKFAVEPKDWRLVGAQSTGKEVQASWQAKADGATITVQSTVRLWQKSLVVDCICTGGAATQLSYGRLENVEAPELLPLPFMNYGSHHLNVLLSKGRIPYFASVWMDWYRSNASTWRLHRQDRRQQGLPQRRRELSSENGRPAQRPV